MADRIFINRKYKETVEDWSTKNILDFKVVENIEKFTLAAALGINSPTPIRGSKEGYVRLQSIPSDSKAILSSILLGIAKNEEIDQYANEEKCYEEAEKCVESGMLKLKDKIDSSNGDENLLCKRLLDEIDLLYETHVKPKLVEDK